MLLLVFVMSIWFAISDYVIYNSSQKLSCGGCYKDLFSGQFNYCDGSYAGSTKTDCEWVGGPGECTFAPVYSITVSECAALCANDAGCHYYTNYHDSICNLHFMTQCDPFSTQAAGTVYKKTSANPTTDPTKDPTMQPTVEPTMHPTNDPTNIPTISPTIQTTSPSEHPTISPSNPSKSPTVFPTSNPTYQPTLYPTETPTNVPTTIPTISTTNIPSLTPTKTPTINPTIHPIKDSTNDPTIYPIFDHTKEPTTNPTYEPTSNPTKSPTISTSLTFTPTITDTIDKEVDSLTEVSVGRTLWNVIIILGSLGFIIFFCCVYYIFSRLSRRTKAPRNASWSDAIKQFGVMQYVGVILELSDIATDYIFATDLIVSPSAGTSLQTLGWISLIVAVIGVILFFSKYLLLKKLLGEQIKRFRNKLKEEQSDEKRKEIMKEIRVRKIDIGVLSLLNSSIEDIPQTLIILIYLTNFGFSYISVVSISLSLLSFMMKLFDIFLTKLGCNDVNDGNDERSYSLVEGNYRTTVMDKYANEGKNDKTTVIQTRTEMTLVKAVTM